MYRRSLVMFAGLVAIVAVLSWGTGNVWAQPSQCDGTLHYTYTEGVMRSISNCDREAAAARAAAGRAAVGGSYSLLAVTPGGMPDYLGTTPNYANSPLPAVDAIVSIGDFGNGTGATAKATVQGGVITGITVINGGSGYNAPNVSIISNSGSGAAATATVEQGVITVITVTNGGSGYAISGGMRKFVDTLPGVGSANHNDLGQFIPIARADTTTFPASDYYRIGVVDYTEQMHSDLPATHLRGYADLSPQADGGSVAHYMGPLIVASRHTPTRVELVNQIVPNSGYFLPVDTTIMGAGEGPLDSQGGSCNFDTQNCASYSPNRALFHLHGGDNPWISDGTPHQWVTPPGETTMFKKGLSFRNVPDMVNGSGVACADTTGNACFTPSDDDGLGTYYWPNGLSSRLMFYHDHAFGITRLNVYAGEAAGYIIHDPVEDNLISTGVIPDQAGLDKTQGAVGGGVYNWGVPLIIQDKSFVPPPAQLAAEDPTWDTAKWGGYGNLWFPHVYMPNQNPADEAGVNAMGRWDYGPWFWPPMDPSTLVGQPVQCPGYPTGVMCPGTPNPSIVPEAFMDTPIINGTAYPVFKVGKKAYRFRVLNASNDRTIGLQLYYAADANGNVCNGTVSDNGPTTICTEVNMVPAVPHASSSTPPLCTPTTTDPNGLAIAAVDGTGYPINNGTGLPAGCWPTTWPTDSRDGGVPDPSTAGPAIIQIGNEGGLLPAPVIVPSTPVGYNYNRRDIVVLNVSNHSIMLGPAERADIIIDFSQVPDGSRLIMYNDSPAPIPAYDTRYDYYTGDPDQTDTGGAPSTLPGYGPNTRTMMQFQIDSTLGAAAGPFDVAGLDSAFAPTPPAQGPFAETQPTPIVPESVLGAAFGTMFTDTYSSIFDTSLTFTPIDPVTGMQTGRPITLPIIRKAIQELFELKYGRMNATLGTELPLTNFTTQTTIPLGYVDPPTEIIKNGETQVWKVTHNGVDTHSIHVHLFNVQLINRVGWDGAVRPPDSNELGWKETVRMNPLEDVIIALKPIKPSIPLSWGPLPDSIRPLDVTRPLHSTGDQFINVDPYTNAPVTTTNELTDFYWEYVWHCHLLGHEENDMMRPIVFQVPTAAPPAPTSLTADKGPVVPPATQSNTVVLNWTAGIAASEPNQQTGFRIERSTNDCSNLSPIITVAASITTYTDTLVDSGTTYCYRVIAFNAIGDSTPSNTATVTTDSWPKATGVDIAADPAPLGSPLPEHYAMGTAVVFTPTATGSTVPYQYRFNLDGGVVQDYGIGTTWTLPANTPIGSYTLTVDVRTSLTSTTPDVTSAPLTVTVAGQAGTVLLSPIGTYYVNLTGAFGDATNGNTIEAWAVPFINENIIFTPAVGIVTFIGGYDSSFLAHTGMTTLQGSLSVGGGSGALIIQNLIIQ